MSYEESAQNKFYQYPQKGILAKMPSDYIGIAKQLSKIKKIRMMSQKQFDSFHHQVSSIQKINQNLAKSLNKKKKQFKYLQAVRNRYIHQSIQKDKLSEMKQIQLQRLRTKTIQQKQKFQTRLADARQRLMFRKKTQCQETKKQLNHYKSQKIMEDSRMYQKNQSRVKQIQQQKVRIKDYYNRFFQNKNKKVMYNYKQLIDKQIKTQMNYKTEMKNLQKKLVLLKNNAQNKQKMLDDLNTSIDSLRQSRESIRSSSRVRSTSRMTPLQIISGTAGSSYTSTNNPQKLIQKPRIKLVQRY